MSAPIVYISHFRIKAGRQDEFWQMVNEVLPGLEADKPRTAFQNFYVDEAGSIVTIVHIFADTESMDAHMEGAPARSQSAIEFLEPVGFEVYGQPTESFLASLRGVPDAEELLRVQPHHRAGFSRFPA